MLNVTLRQYSWNELMRPFGDDKPISDEEFMSLMAPTNTDTPIDRVPLTALTMRDPVIE